MGRRIIDDETGEIIQDGSTISTPAQTKQRRKYYENMRRIEELEEKEKDGRKEKFIFNVLDNVDYVTEVLTTAQCGYLLVLSTYIDYSGLLVTSERDGRVMRTSDMMEVLGIRKTQRNSLYDFLRVCKDAGIIKEVNGEYFVSDDINKKGTPPNSNVCRSYVQQLRRMAKGNKPEHIGIIYALIPYINKYHNRLCENPNEKLKDKLIYLTRPRLAEIARVSPKHITNITTQMVHGKGSVFAKITTATDGTFYMLSYHIFRRAEVMNYDGEIIDIFAE